MKTPVSMRKQILSVIDKQRRVTIPDVVAETGLSLDTVATALNELAAEARANLDVTSRGIIYYQFPDDLHFRLYSSRLAFLANRVWAIVSPHLYFLFRISFGLILVLSLAFISFIMLVLQLLMSAASGQTNAAIDVLKDFFYLLKRLFISKHAPLPFFKPEAKAVNTELKTVREEQKDQGFLLNCYSFLFGLGDANKDFEAEQSHLVARLIRANNGIVLPEQLAPYTGIDPGNANAMFPFLFKFNGMPASTSNGQLVYVFPDLQAENAWTGAATDAEALPTKLTMKPLVFAGIGREAMVKTVILASVNFFGCVFFWWLLFAAHSASIDTTNMFLLMVAYAAFFLMFPAVRWVNLTFRNKAIKKYNAGIEQFEQNLLNPSQELAAKIAEAEKMRQESGQGTVDKLVYTTSRDFLEQEADRLSEPL